MSMTLRPSRLRLTQAVYFGHTPGFGLTTLDAGPGITLTPNPIITTGIVSLAVPVTVPSGGTGAITLTGILKGNGVGPITGGATVDLTIDVTGVLPVPHGGTGAATLTGILQGNGTGPITGNATINLTTQVTGILPYANGGTNAATAWTPGSIILAGATTFVQDPTKLFWDVVNHRFGLGTNVPTRTLDLVGTQRFRGVAAPPVSEANSATVYFDQTTNKLMTSFNGSAYVPMIGSGGGGSVGGSGVVGRVAYWTGLTSISDALVNIDGPTGNIGAAGAPATYPVNSAGDINIVTGVIRWGGNQGLAVEPPGVALGIGTSIKGLDQVWVGTAAGMSATGNENIGIGGQALYATTTGRDNTAVGYAAGLTNVDGYRNVFIGALADAAVGNLHDAGAIGAGASVAQNNSLNIGGGIQAVGILNPTPKATLDVYGSLAVHLEEVTLTNGLNSDITPIIPAGMLRIVGPSAGFSIGGFHIPTGIGGIIGPVAGQVLYVFNSVAFQMTIVNEDAASFATQRIMTLTGADVVLRAGVSAATFVYDDAVDRWLLMNSN